MPSRTDECDERAARGGAEREGREARDREVAVRLLHQIGADDLAHEAVERRVVERDRRAAERLEHDQLPDVRVARDEQHAHRHAHAGARNVGRDHHRAARQPVADDAAEREHRHLGDRPRREGEADGRCASAPIQDREGDRDRRQVRPDVGDRAPGEEEPEVAVAERVHDRIIGS